MTHKEFLTQERERVAKRVTATVVSANLLRWLGGLSNIPHEVAEAGRAVLHKAQQSGDIRDCRVHAFGNDLLLQVNTLGQGLRNPNVHRLVCEAAAAALTRAADLGLCRPLHGKDFLRLSPRERIEALHLRLHRTRGRADRHRQADERGRRRLQPHAL